MDWLVNFFNNLSFESVMVYISSLGSIIVAIYSIYSKCKFMKHKDDVEDINAAVEQKATKFIVASTQAFNAGMETTLKQYTEMMQRLDNIEKNFNEKQEEEKAENEAKIEENKVKVSKEIEELKSLQEEV
nr:MAG TPA: hypothetical protein [Caudoviricetes sp.]